MNAHQLLRLAEQQFGLGDLRSAEDLLRKLLRLDPSAVRAHELLAYIAGRRNDFDACEQHLLKASSLAGCSAEALFHLGSLQLQRGRAQAAIASFQRVVDSIGDQFEPLHEMGVARSGLGDSLQALQLFKRAEAKNPRSATLQFNIANVLASLGRQPEAIQHYDRALALEPALQAALGARGQALADLGRGEEALQSLDLALRLDPTDVASGLCRAATLSSHGRAPEARLAYEAVAALPVDTDYTRGYWLHGRLMACRWEWWPEALADVLARVARDERAIVPFYFLALPAGPREQLACARSYARDQGAAASGQATQAQRKPSNKIRVGYFSTDFYDHATSQLLAGVLEHHDRDRFEWHAYALSLPAHDAMTERVAKAVDRFVSVTDLSDAEVTALARADGLDIAIDLNGFTDGARPGVFARRAAPIQVNYLGFPGTMGCDFMDYIVADDVLIPPVDYDAYAEKVVRLPHSYQPNDNTKQIADQTTRREDHGLPSTGFVFACFNNSYKITPDLFDVWARLLVDIPASILWLLEPGGAARLSLEHEMTRHGVDRQRLVWAPRLPMPQHLERHRHADLFLDTFYYNAHTTCSDALWAGLPVLTMEGSTFASRVGSSLLRAVGLEELVCASPAAYGERARALATSRNRELIDLRGRLARDRHALPLFDTARHARHLESAYRTMVQRLSEGLAPDHFAVAP